MLDPKKNIGSKQLLGPKKILVQKKFWIIISVEKIYVKIFWTKQISGTRKLKVKQKYWVQRSLGQNFFCPKEFLTLEKYFGSEKNFGPPTIPFKKFVVGVEYDLSFLLLAKP